MVIPLLLAKGLEFDAVILFNCIRSNQENAHMRRKVYLGCTRALHELYFIEREGLPDSLESCVEFLEIMDWGGWNGEAGYGWHGMEVGVSASAAPTSRMAEISAKGSGAI